MTYLNNLNRSLNFWYSLLLFSVVLLLTQCSEDDDPIPLVANAGSNQTVNVKELVTLDGSKSEGPAGFTYQWTYNGEVPESEINFQGTTTAKPTFVPPKGVTTSFRLPFLLAIKQARMK